MNALIKNLIENIPSEMADEYVEELVKTTSLRLERIVSRGHASPPDFWYDQNEAEWVLVVDGKARLLLLDPEEHIELQKGDHLLIPAHRRHRVEWTSPEMDTIWLALFFAKEEE